MMNTILRRGALTVLVLGLLAGPAAAQDKPPAVPDAKALQILVRNTVIAVNHGNLTGNYTVLRDLAAPGFASVNDASRLASIFRAWRDDDIDLSPIVLFDPVWTVDPRLDKKRRLRLKGYFATQPLQINFDLAYELIDNRWRLWGIALTTL